jgi:hypothetical protein
MDHKEAPPPYQGGGMPQPQGPYNYGPQPGTDYHAAPQMPQYAGQPQNHQQSYAPPVETWIFVENFD